MMVLILLVLVEGGEHKRESFVCQNHIAARGGGGRFGGERQKKWATKKELKKELKRNLCQGGGDLTLAI